MAATATVNPFRIMDNSVLDSSMDSTQGLLGFMASASRQIKTYLGPEQQQKSNQNKRRHQQLLFQLSQLKTQNYSFIPDILAPSNTKTFNSSPCINNTFCGVESSPASPTPSLDSVGSVEDIDAPTYRSSCLIKSRRQKRTRPSIQCSMEDNITSKRTKYINNCSISPSTCALSEIPNVSLTSMDPPCPSPDFDDLVDCMLTEDALAMIDVNNYLPQL
ncbi:uncharacterized protein [Clytia hemisphaerica]|uniref:Uncharacterized protein n=1 Tax=Clytia hemisphaerica TaxID=252671 RepID=A0A7M6DQ04_9CNID